MTPEALPVEDCEAWVIPDWNACGGHTDFSLSLVDVRDADGDGVWEPGERLELDVALFSTAEHMNYPGLALYPLAAETTLDGPTEMMWWYGVFAGQTLEATVVFEALPGANPASLTAVAIGVGSACSGAQGGELVEDQCPNPSPMVVEL